MGSSSSAGRIAAAAGGQDGNAESPESFYDSRVNRAGWLLGRFPAATEPLRFAQGLFRAQAAMAQELTGLGHPDDDLARVATAARGVFEYVARAGPPVVSAEARRRIDAGLVRALGDAWKGSEPLDYLSRAVFSVYLMSLRLEGRASGRPPGPCSFCGGRPWVASRRSATSTDGASRYLHCAYCAAMWQAPRIRCVSCGEADPEKLPIFSSASHAGAVVEACESCHRYLKSIDLTDDARRIPDVDDLASLALDLWAAAGGFTRVEAGVAGPLPADET